MQVVMEKVEDDDDDTPDVIDFSIRRHRENGQLVLAMQQGNDLIVVPVETDTMALNMADDIAKAIQTFSNYAKIAKPMASQQ